MSKLAIAEQFYSPTVKPKERVQTLMGVTCDDCGESFDNKKALAGHARGECEPDIDGREIRRCEVCGSEFKDYPSHEKQTCSKECADELRASSLDGRNTGSGESVELTCQNCGEQFVRWKSQAEAYENNLCSRECANEFHKGRFSGEDNAMWEGGWSPEPFGDNWYEQREKALKRDSYQCQDCGLEDGQHQQTFGHGLHVHHLTPRSEFDDLEEANKIDNLVVLCNPCHQRRENQ